MTLDTILQTGNDDIAECRTQTGEWFVATEALSDKSVEEFTIENQTGALVLASRRGFWNADLRKQNIEIFLSGTPEQLAAAQQMYELYPLVGALLDRPEP
ncbi:MAG: hypothetical protein SGJ27_05890 [Candidatus Melainabacteria bacterium]|nr:hypothetical protein [Candidatus Melainabacteria bacterium]